MAGEEQRPVAGWYRDPEQPQTQRYWDGTRWTDQRAPLAPEPRKTGAGVLLVASYVAAVLIPIVGLILGVVLLIRRETVHGIAVVLISLAIAVAGYFLVIDETENGRRDRADRIERQVEDRSGFRALEACLRQNDFRFSACRDVNPLE
jgi:hypothetical protein